MVNVNVDKLKSVEAEYSNALKREKENNNNIFQGFNNLTKCWHDTHIDKMSSNYNSEKHHKLSNTQRNTFTTPM